MIYFSQYFRDDFKTQPAVDRQFRPASIVLNNETAWNRAELPVSRQLGFEVAPQALIASLDVKDACLFVCLFAHIKEGAQEQDKCFAYSTSN